MSISIFKNENMQELEEVVYLVCLGFFVFNLWLVVLVMACWLLVTIWQTAEALGKRE